MRVFITGGTSGIGLELAKLYLAQGDQVAICGRDLNKVPKEIESEYLSCFELSVLDKKAVKEAIDFFAKDGLDLVIANAGRSSGNKERLLDWDLAHQILETNILGVSYTFAAAYPHLLAQKSGQLVGVASVAGFVGLSGTAAYSASKSAVIKLCESLSIDLAPEGIAVTCVSPGFIATPLTAVNKHPMPFIMPATKAALKIKKAIEKKKINYVFPWPMKALMIFLQLLPRNLYRFLISSQSLNFIRR